MNNRVFYFVMVACASFALEASHCLQRITPGSFFSVAAPKVARQMREHLNSTVGETKHGVVWSGSTRTDSMWFFYVKDLDSVYTSYWSAVMTVDSAKLAEFNFLRTMLEKQAHFVSLVKEPRFVCGSFEKMGQYLTVAQYQRVNTFLLTKQEVDLMTDREKCVASYDKKNDQMKKAWEIYVASLKKAHDYCCEAMYWHFPRLKAIEAEFQYSLMMARAVYLRTVSVIFDAPVPGLGDTHPLLATEKARFVRIQRQQEKSSLKAMSAVLASADRNRPTWN